MRYAAFLRCGAEAFGEQSLRGTGPRKGHAP